MKLKIVFLILSFLALSFPTLSLRGVNPRSNLKIIGIATAAEPLRNDTNKFGIHILEPGDLPKAQELVNSSGGDWGWVTVVIRDDDMNFDKWQGFMDECRERHLIPLVRIATHLEGSNWAKPKIEDASKWADFLNRLNWPIKDQYVIIFNEPNHAKEWGGEINPKEYSKILLDFSAKFKVQSAKFRILNAGLDLAAPNGKTTMDAFKFMQEMNFEVPGIFEQLDGWTSHSYPNHGYRGKPWDLGKTSVKGYDWELTILKKTFLVQKNFLVFITETGWPHGISKSEDQRSKTQLKAKNNFYNESIVSDYIKYAFENVWLKDERVKAVTPFVLNYPDDLFADFSWLDKNGQPFPQFESIKNTGKVSWLPEQETKYEIKSIFLPPFLPANTKFQGKIHLKNIGQSIWGERGRMEILPGLTPGIELSKILISEDRKIKPGETIILDFEIASLSQPGEFEFNWENLPKQKIKVFPSSILSRTRYNFWEKVILKLKSIFI